MDFLDETSEKRFKTEKKERNHRILHIRNSLGTKFQLKLTILKKNKMKITIEFYIFELV